MLQYKDKNSWFITSWLWVYGCVVLAHVILVSAPVPRPQQFMLSLCNSMNVAMKKHEIGINIAK